MAACTMTPTLEPLLFVTAVSSLDTLRRRLLASPCLQPGRRPLVLRWNARVSC